MKTFTSLSAIRLFALAFTLGFVLITGSATACGNTIYCTGSGTVEYASLAASATQNGVFINWVTVAELNNSHFEVERSTDNKSFKTVAMVLDGFTATGTTGKSYKFKEGVVELKKSKTVYYRLKQIDNDNQVHYSSVMAVQMNTVVTIIPQQAASKAVVAVKSNFQPVYTSNQTLLSKQTSSMGKTIIPVVSSVELATGILTACELILGTELYTPKLSMA